MATKDMFASLFYFSYNEGQGCGQQREKGKGDRPSNVVEDKGELDVKQRGRQENGKRKWG